MTPSARLIARLRAMGLDIPEGARVERTYAGRLQRECGAWSWALYSATGFELNIGSQFSVTRLLRGRMCASRPWGWESSDIDIDPWQSSEATPAAWRFYAEEAAR